MLKPTRTLSALLLSVVLLLSACLPGQAPTSPAPGQVGGEPATPTAAYTPTALPLRVLSVCIGEQPNTLFPLAILNGAARSVLSAVYDGPFDMINYQPQPVILEKIPSLADNDAQVNPVSVAAGDKVVDSSGKLVILKVGSRVRPAGCRSEDCAITFNGSSPVSMDQMFVGFHLLPDVMWSDGTPLTADDSIFAYGLAQQLAGPGDTYIFDRTKSYDAADETTVQWWGVPGFIDPNFYSNFWTPLPKHLWSQFSGTDLKTMDLSARLPMGYGPYVLKQWEGDTLRLTKNPFYFRAVDGLPHFDELIFRVTPTADAALSALIEGRCDLIDSTVHLDEQVSLLLELRRTGQAQVYFGQTPTMEWLAMGIVPASYDDRYDPVNQNDRPDFFGDPRLRQAVAYCLDRKKVVDTVLYSLVPVPDTYISPDHPLHASDLPTYDYNPAAGIKILENLGWTDPDQNPATPRQALGVDRVPPGTNLIVSYLTTSATQRRQVTEILAASLQQCGIGLEVSYMAQPDFFAAGPAGPLFGRNFELAEFAMSTLNTDPPCARFTTLEIPKIQAPTDQFPNAENSWSGTNVTGYKNPSFDAACLDARQSLPGEETYLEAYRQTQSIFANDLPAIPLFNRLEIAAARYNFCNFQLDPTAASDLFAIEAFDLNDTCASAP